MSKPIPKRLLVHTVILRQQAGLDRDRNPIFTETVLRNVRIGVTIQTTRGQIGETKADTMTLYIDMVHTTSTAEDGTETAAVIPEENDGVTWEAKGYTVRSVTPCYTQGNNEAHHYEVILE